MCGILLSQLVGQTVANRGYMASHVDLLSAAEQQLCSRVHLAELPEAFTMQAAERSRLRARRSGLGSCSHTHMLDMCARHV